jgi:hypothetical protein
VGENSGGTQDIIFHSEIKMFIMPHIIQGIGNRIQIVQNPMLFAGVSFMVMGVYRECIGMMIQRQHMERLPQPFPFFRPGNEYVVMIFHLIHPFAADDTE